MKSIEDKKWDKIQSLQLWYHLDSHVFEYNQHDILQ